MEILELKHLNRDSLCRLCLKESNDLRPLSDNCGFDDNCTYLQILHFLLKVDGIVNEAEMPQNCCAQCKCEMEISFGFIKRIMECDRKLRHVNLNENNGPILAINVDTTTISGLNEDLTCHVCNKTEKTLEFLILHLEEFHLNHLEEDCKVCENILKNNEEIPVDPILFHEVSSRENSKILIKKKRKNDVPKELEYYDSADAKTIPEYCRPQEKQISCRICDISFDKIADLRSHLNLHTYSDSLIVLPLLNKDYLFESHSLNLKTSNINYLAEIIVKDLVSGNNRKYYNISNDKGHEFELSDSDTDCEDDTKIHKCEACEKSFNRMFEIISHIKTDHNIEDFKSKCNHCLKSFPNKIILAKHERNQCMNQEKSLECTICHTKFKWKFNLDRHNVFYHARSVVDVNDKRKYQCKICDKSFSRQEHLERHIKIHIPSEKRFECEICHKKFNRNDNLRSHMKIHNDNRDNSNDNKHLCVYCGRSFSNSSNLIVHMRRHTGEKPYRCDLCDKGFPRSSDLQCHRRTHTGEKPCICAVCGKGFSRSNKLVRHMRIHTGVRPYKCSFCDRAFTQSNDLTLHIRRHTGDKPYVCGVCGDRFIQGTALHQHRRSQGHYEEDQSGPFAAISVNNPNRFTNANRVNRVGTITTESLSTNQQEVQSSHSATNPIIVNTSRFDIIHEHSPSFTSFDSTVIEQQYTQQF